MLATSRKKPHPAAVGRDVDVLVDVGADEQQRVGAVLALDGVAAVARVPRERVVAGAEEGRCRCRGRRSTKSLPSPPSSVSAPWLPSDGVVAGAAVDGQLDDAGRQGGRR